MLIRSASGITFKTKAPEAGGEDYGNGDSKVTLAELQAYLDDEMTYQARRRYNRDQKASVQGKLDSVLATVR